MTARREARSGRGLLSTVEIDGAMVPADLLNPDAPTWRSNTEYRAWLDAHGLTSDLVQLRFDVDTHPNNRRNYAAQAWAESTGALCESGNPTRVADWRRLRAAGLIA